jgi:hypothetical protein
MTDQTHGEAKMTDQTHGEAKMTDQTPDHYTVDCFGPEIDEKFGDYGPAQYAIVFNREGEALIFTREGIGVKDYRDDPATFHSAAFQDNPELTLLHIHNISVLLTNKGHLINSACRKPGGAQPCNWHRIG